MPIVDHGVQTVPKTIQVSLFGPSPIGLASPSTAVLTILNDDPMPAPDPATRWACRCPRSPATRSRAPASSSIAERGRGRGAAGTRRWPSSPASRARRASGTFSYGSQRRARRSGLRSRGYLTRAAVESPGSIPLLATYRLVDGHCGNWADPPASRPPTTTSSRASRRGSAPTARCCSSRWTR